MEAVEWLEREAQRWKAAGGNLYVSGVKKSVKEFLRKGEYLEKMGEENFFSCKVEAISGIFPNLDEGGCANCTTRIFRECPKAPPSKTT